MEASPDIELPVCTRGIITKKLPWNQSLVCSFVGGLSIGAGGNVQMARRPALDGEVREYFNIEDGGTRLRALKEFWADEERLMVRRGMMMNMMRSPRVLEQCLHVSSPMFAQCLRATL